MMARLRPPRANARRSARPTATPYVPADPASLGISLDPALSEIRATLAPHRRRLWLRRATRRAWSVAAAVAVAELVLAVAQRLLPLEGAPLVALAFPVVGMLGLLGLVVRARPSLGETALAVDAEGGSGDAVASSLAFAVQMPATAGPSAAANDGLIAVDGAFDITEAEARFVRRQRRDALGRLRTHRSGAVPPAVRAPARPRGARCGSAGGARRPDPEPDGPGHRAEPADPAGGGAPGGARRPDREGPREPRRRPPGSEDPARRAAARARRAAAHRPGQSRSEPRPPGRRGGRGPGAAGPVQRATRRLDRRALPLAVTDGDGQCTGEPGR